MKPYKFFVICFIIILAGLCRNAVASSWSDDHYSKHTQETFEKYDYALERIDMNNIDYPLLHAAIFFETNRIRSDNGLPLFIHSQALEKAARGHSSDMVEMNFFAHESSVKGKETLSKRLELVGIKNSYCGENISQCHGIEYEPNRNIYLPVQNGGYFSYEYRGAPIKNHTYIGLARAVIKRWMASPGHRKNILERAYTYLGTGAAHYRNSNFHGIDSFKLTQNFSK